MAYCFDIPPQGGAYTLYAPSLLQYVGNPVASISVSLSFELTKLGVVHP